MATFDDMEHISRSLNACICYEISSGYEKRFDDRRLTLKAKRLGPGQPVRFTFPYGLSPLFTELGSFGIKRF